MQLAPLRYRVAKGLAPYPVLFRSTRALFRLLVRIRSEDSYLLDVARRHDDVFFLQIGANDGVLEDHLHPFVHRFGWRGLLMEPIRSYYDRLVANYAGVPNLIFENKALADQDGPRTMYRLRDGVGGAPAWSTGVGSFDRDAVVLHRESIPDIENSVVEQTVECITFRTLVAQHDLQRIDVVVIDTEGYDLEILRQLDFDRFHPELVIYEQVLLSEEDKVSARHLLEQHDYTVYPIGPNNAAVRTGIS